MGGCLSKLCWDTVDDDEHEPISSKSLRTPPRSEGPQAEEPLLANEHEEGRPGDDGNVQHRRTGAMASPGTSRSGGRRSGGSAGKSLKDYELLAFLGQGSFAEVTLARHKSTRELFAVKKISKRKVREEGSVERAFTERHILASLRHPFLVKLHQAFQSSTHLYLVLQFAHGGDFRTFLQGYHKHAATAALAASTLSDTTTSDAALGKSQGSTTTAVPNCSTSSFATTAGLPLDMVYFYATEVAIALVFLHEKGFVYRDLKPENILMQRDGHIMLTDFGVAKHHTPIGVGNAEAGVGSSSTAASEQREAIVGSTRGGGDGPPPPPSTKKRARRSSFVGTRQYMSPEVLQGNPHDCKTDWWSFGCWVYEMFAGRGLFDDARTEYQLFVAIVEAPVALTVPDVHDVVLTQRCAPIEPLDDVPRHTQEAASALVDLLGKLLVRDASQRLGGIAVLQHPFFRLSCWDKLFERHTPVANVDEGVGANSYGSVATSGTEAAATMQKVLATMQIPSQDTKSSQGTSTTVFENVQQFLCKCVAPPYVPRLRGNEDLRCFPCAVSCSATCRIVNNSSVSTAVAAASASPSVQPSDELFEFMLHIDGGPSPLAPQDTAAATAYYEDAARPSDSVDVHGDDAASAAVSSPHPAAVPSAAATEGDAAPNPATGSDTTAPSSPALVGVSYVIDPPDSPQEDGGMDASMSYAGGPASMGGQNHGFDGYSIMFMRADSRHPSSSQLRSAGGGEYAMWSHRVDHGDGFLPSNEHMSSGLASPASQEGRPGAAPHPNAFANFTYQEPAPSYLGN